MGWLSRFNISQNNLSRKKTFESKFKRKIAWNRSWLNYKLQLKIIKLQLWNQFKTSIYNQGADNSCFQKGKKVTKKLLKIDWKSCSKNW